MGKTLSVDLTLMMVTEAETKLLSELINNLQGFGVNIDNLKKQYKI